MINKEDVSGWTHNYINENHVDILINKIYLNINNQTYLYNKKYLLDRAILIINNHDVNQMNNRVLKRMSSLIKIY